MPTEQPALRIRRATPLDAVNLYRLVVDDERKAGTELEYDEAARIAHILHVIASGYVTVVEKSGRIVGSFGFAAGGPEYAKSKILDSAWCVLHPSLAHTQVAARLVQRLTAFADKHGVGVQITVPGAEPTGVDNFLAEFGFVASKRQFVREPTSNDERSDEERAEDASIARVAGPSAGPVSDGGDDDSQPGGAVPGGEAGGDVPTAERRQPRERRVPRESPRT
jgi:N-acetylglutamate synthase and related acetyltransferases